MSMTWEEACKFLWKGPMTGTTYQFKIEGDSVYYYSEESPRWERWVNSEYTTPEIYLIGMGYTIAGDNPDYIFVPLEEKICKKIVMMEARWLAFQQRKQHEMV